MAFCRNCCQQALLHHFHFSMFHLYKHIFLQDLNQLNWCEKWQKRASLPEQIKEKSDIIDALICAYVAKKYKEGDVCKCESKEYQEAATLEGWIWIPILK